MKTLIGVTGYAGHGKDTFADHLVRVCRYQKLSFATPIKEALNEIFGWTMRDWNNRKFKETPRPEAGGKTPRQLAQTLGTEWGRNLVSNDLWVELTLDRARRSPQPVVIADVRFPNEAALIRENGGILVLVRRPEVVPDLSHTSEQYIEKITPDVHVFNIKGVEELEAQAESVARLIETGLIRGEE